MEFKIETLENVEIEIIDGDRGKNYPNGEDFKKDKYCLFLNAKNVTNEGFKFEETMFINREKDEVLRKGKLKRGDIVLTTRGTVGNIAYYSEKVPFNNIRINSGMIILRSRDIDKINNKFIYWYMKSDKIQKEIMSIKTGSAQPQLPISILKNLQIKLPSIEFQNKIVSLLESIQNKIELNSQINDNLYEMTNRLYEQVFIKERQDEWEEYNLQELAEIFNGYSYKGKELVENSNVGMATIKNFERSGGFKEEGFKAIEPIKAKDIHYANKFDILVACTDLTQNADIIGNAIMLLNTGRYEEVVISMDLVKVIPKRNKYLIYSILNSSEFKNFALGYKTGTTVLHLNKKCFNDFNIKLPNQNKIESFEKIVEVNYKKISSNLEENNILIKLRDTLLPKLINGEIDLDKIEI